MKKLIQKLWKDESAQGMTEYILLLVVVVGLFIVFKDQIKGQIDGLISKLSGMITNATTQL